MREAHCSWIQVAALLLGSALSHSGCGGDAFVVVEVNGTDDRVQQLVVAVTAGALKASEVYVGHPPQVSFFLPAGTLGAALSVDVDAWGTTCLLSTGSASAMVEDRVRFDLSVQLGTVPGCQ